MKLKSWVVKLLGVVTVLMLFVLAAECDSTSLFVLKSIISGGIIMLNCYIFDKYTDLFED